ncbi:Uncharacterized protein Rs2_03028 [Raphanus sativus]|nr:Uncharacterized protein Rs2_03028 [Raphanus sativus]
MAPRYSEEEKGKQQVKGAVRENIKRIKAPALDNTKLIEENALTLIGRLTNPREQRIWALLPALPRKWNLQGKVEGSDLGNNCFLFRFEREDDLLRVLDNRPYHFAYWMVIIQRWEPVISRTFPSTIPFWIKIKGIPLHYWHEDTVRRVGQELGTYEKYELTKTTARVRKHCPLKLQEEVHEIEISGSNSKHASQAERELVTSRAKSGVNYAPSYNPRGVALEEPQESKRHAQTNPPPQVFRERVDRYGNPFGDRVGTKQTRNPPPEKASELENASKQDRKQTQSYTPSYAKTRELANNRGQRNRDLIPRRSEGQWRPKVTSEPEILPGKERTTTVDSQKIETQPGLVLSTTEENANRSREEIMEELNEVTRQYLSCANPVEAAARRQRVLFTDAQGLMERTAENIMASRAHVTLRPHLSDSNPVTPPPLQVSYNQTFISPRRLELLSPINLDEEANALEVGEIATVSANPQSKEQTEDRPARIKSIIVSPMDENRAQPPTSPVILESPSDNQTLLDFQNKAKKKAQSYLKSNTHQGEEPR